MNRIPTTLLIALLIVGQLVFFVALFDVGLDVRSLGLGLFLVCLYLQLKVINLTYDIAELKKRDSENK